MSLSHAIMDIHGEDSVTKQRKFIEALQYTELPEIISRSGSKGKLVYIFCWEQEI